VPAVSRWGGLHLHVSADVSNVAVCKRKICVLNALEMTGTTLNYGSCDNINFIYII
jgi:hypothetical protein